MIDLLASSAIMRSNVFMHRWLLIRAKNLPKVQLTKFEWFILNFNLMIVLATNKSIMRLKLLIMLFEFWSHDKFVSHKNDHEIETLKSIIRQFWPHENRRDQQIESIISNFDLMINNLISWNLTSWPWVFNAMSIFSQVRKKFFIFLFLA